MSDAGVNPKDLVGAKKAALELVPPALIIGAAEAIDNGAGKYGPYNWRDYPIQTMTYVGAMLRHLLAYLDGEDKASDSGIHHLKHVAAGCGILLDAIEAGTAKDNRPNKGPAPEMLAALDRSSPPATVTVDRLFTTGRAIMGREALRADRERDSLHPTRPIAEVGDVTAT